MAHKFTPFQRAWLDALKSGRFRQGRKRLARRLKNKKVEYCCLGVACSIAPKFGVKLKKASKYDTTGHAISFNGESGYLPLAVKDALHFKGVGRNLAMLNDDKRFSFKRIAERVEQYPSLYFL